MSRSGVCPSHRHQLLYLADLPLSFFWKFTRLHQPWRAPCICSSTGSAFAAAQLQQAVLSDDRALLIRMSHGDIDALGQLYDRHASCLFSLALRILRREPRPEVGAEAILLAVFTTLWKEVSEDWIADDYVLPGLTRRVRQMALARRTVAPTCAGGTVAGRAEAASPRGLEPLARLPPLQRAAIELAFYDGLSVTEMARHLNQHEGCVRKAIAEGMRTLAQSFPAHRG